MNVFELLVVALLFVGLPAVIFDGVAKIKRANAKANEGAAIRKSELEALIRMAVEDAAVPLRRRIEALEAIATDEPPAAVRLDAHVLDEAFGDDRAEPVPAETRRDRTAG